MRYHKTKNYWLFLLETRKPFNLLPQEGASIVSIPTFGWVTKKHVLQLINRVIVDMVHQPLVGSARLIAWKEKIILMCSEFKTRLTTHISDTEIQHSTNSVPSCPELLYACVPWTWSNQHHQHSTPHPSCFRSLFLQKQAVSTETLFRDLVNIIRSKLLDNLLSMLTFVHILYLKQLYFFW